jgi:hypothetical protein
MNWKDEGSGRDLNYVLSINMSGETEENHKKLSQDSRSPGRDLNQAAPEYRATALLTTFSLSFRYLFFLWLYTLGSMNAYILHFPVY